MAALTVDSENTVDQHQQMTWQPKSSLTVETSHWTSSNMDYVPLHSSSRLWDLVSKWNAKFTFIWKEDFGPLSNSPVLFLHSPGKMLLTLSLVQKWLGSPFPEDISTSSVNSEEPEPRPPSCAPSTEAPSRAFWLAASLCGMAPATRPAASPFNG